MLTIEDIKLTDLDYRILSRQHPTESAWLEHKIDTQTTELTYELIAQIGVRAFLTALDQDEHFGYL